MFSSKSPQNTCLVNQRFLLGVVMYQNPSISPSEGLWNKTSKTCECIFIYVYYIHSWRAMHWCRCLDHGRICHDSVKLRKLGWMNPQSLVFHCAKKVYHHQNLYNYQAEILPPPQMNPSRRWNCQLWTWRCFCQCWAWKPGKNSAESRWRVPPGDFSLKSPLKIGRLTQKGKVMIVFQPHRIHVWYFIFSFIFIYIYI